MGESGSGGGPVGGKRGDRFVWRRVEVAIDYLIQRSDVFVKGPLTGMGVGSGISEMKTQTFPLRGMA